MKQLRFSAFVMAVALVAMLGAPALAVADETLKARLDGYQETPALSTTGEGEFQAKINETETEIAFKLDYRDLEGPAAAAHIHLGRPGVTGGIIAFLCGGGDGKPACPVTEGTVTGTIVAADVIGPELQGIAPGEIDALIAAMLAGATYVNVHTPKYPSGEIRGAVTKGKKRGH